MKKEEAKENLRKLSKKESKFVNEFKAFILKGSVLDLAVGVLIGSAFQGLVTSLTDNIISPILGCFSEVNFNQFTLDIWNLHLRYGAFLTDVINFIIMAFVIFLIVKFFNKLRDFGKKEEKVETKKVESEETKLLKEIRDLLKENKKNSKK